MIWYDFVGIVWYGGQMTSEFIHEEISIMDYNGLSWTIMGGGSQLAWMMRFWSWTIIDYHELL